MTNERLNLSAGLGIGAGLMLPVDPRAGRRRRALLRDKMAHAAHKTADAAGLTAVVGAGLLARGLTGLQTRRLLGIRAGRRAVGVQKTIRIAAPLERVFQFWTHYENFPQFMSRVRGRIIHRPVRSGMAWLRCSVQIRSTRWTRIFLA